MTSNENLFLSLYDGHYDELWAFCARRVGTDSATDTTAEIFLVLWRRIDDVPVGVERGWLYGVARGVVSNHWRSGSRRRRLIERLRSQHQPVVVDPVGIVENDSAQQVRSALARLRGADQEILRLASWDELSGPEIAEVLQISLAAVQQRLTRARKRLVAELERKTSNRRTSSYISEHSGAHRRGMR